PRRPPRPTLFPYTTRVRSWGGDLLSMVYRDPPHYMLRMRAVRELLPAVVVMDTGAAAVLGTLGDPVVARDAATGGAILVNVGNLHTFAVAVRGLRVLGLFEHHTGGVTPAKIGRASCRERT